MLARGTARLSIITIIYFTSATVSEPNCFPQSLHHLEALNSRVSVSRTMKKMPRRRSKSGVATGFTLTAARGLAPKTNESTVSVFLE